MKILKIIVLSVLIAIAKGQWVATARGLYQPVLLSFGSAFAFFNEIAETDFNRFHDWLDDKVFNKKPKNEDQKKEK